MIPEGTLTFLLTDVEHITRAWDAGPSSSSEVASRLDALLASAVSTHGGVRPVESGAGESAVGVFTSAARAVAAALAAQRAIAEESWPAGRSVLVRMGLHTGDAPWATTASTRAPTITRAAHLRDLGRPGQIVTSAATAALMVDDVPAGAALVSSGEHHFAGLSRPEQLWQLVHPDLPASGGPLEAARPQRPGRPPQLTVGLVGRDADRAELVRLVGEHRLLTITGAGGVGKTSLAAQVAHDLDGSAAGGVTWVSLAGLVDPDEVAAVVAVALGAPEAAGVPTETVLTNWLSVRRVLLVLDNCEHLVPRVSELCALLLGAAAELRIVATSREPLGCAGEVTWRTPSLALPPADCQTDPRVAASFPAVQLFVERAGAARNGFALDSANVDDVVQVCRRLDGVPLAIELAASCVRHMSPHRLASSLDERFRVLTGGARSGLPRQRTLAASVAWSVDLLGPTERQLLVRLCVFAGPFTVEATEAVCTGDGIDCDEVFETLLALVDRSLVQHEDGPDRYRLHETIRHFAQEEAERTGVLTNVRDQHLHWCRDECAALTEDRGLLDKATSDRASDLRPELLAAVRWACTTAVEDGLALLPVLGWLWDVQGHYAECSQVVDTMLAAAGSDRRLRLRVLAAPGPALLWAGGDDLVAELAEGLPDLEDDPTDRMRAAMTVGHAGLMTADPAGEATLWEGIELARQLGRRADEVFGLVGMADTMGTLGRLRDARQLLARVDALGAEPTGPALGMTLTARSHCAANEDLGQAFALALAAHSHMPGQPAALLIAGMFALLARRADWNRALTPLDEPGRHWGLLAASVCMDRLSNPLYLADRIDEAAQALELAMALPSTGILNYNLLTADAGIAIHQGDHRRAEQRLDETATAIGDRNLPRIQVLLRLHRASLALQRGETTAARSLAQDALAIADRNDLVVGTIDALEALAVTLSRTAAPEHAARIAGATEAHRNRTGYRRRHAAVTGDIEQILTTADPDLLAAGARLSLDEAIALATRNRGPRRRPPTGWDALTPMENEVVGLAGAGLTNREIAERLFVSVATVKTHLVHAYPKLGLASRSQLVRAVTDRSTSSRDSEPYSRDG